MVQMVFQRSFMGKRLASKPALCTKPKLASQSSSSRLVVKAVNLPQIADASKQIKELYKSTHSMPLLIRLAWHDSVSLFLPPLVDRHRCPPAPLSLSISFSSNHPTPSSSPSSHKHRAPIPKTAPTHGQRGVEPPPPSDSSQS